MGTPGKIFGKNSKHTHKNFLYDPFTGRRVQRPFGWRCERELPEPTANGGRGTDNPKEGLGLMLLLSVSNLILFYIVFVCVVVVAINFFSFFFNNKCNCFLVVGRACVMMSLVGLFASGACVEGGNA